MRLTIPSSGDVCRLADNYGPLLAGLFGHGPLSPFPQSFRTKIRNSLAILPHMADLYGFVRICTDLYGFVRICTEGLL